MLFNLILLVLIGAVAFFHYVQGLFGATISAILAIISAAIAIGYYEPLAGLMAPKFPEAAMGISLVVLFAAVYIVLRLIMDKLVPGNVRFPVLMDKIGAGAMGVLVGLIATGVVAIATQSLSFSASIAGYSRYKIADETMGHYKKGGQWQDVKMYEIVNSKDNDIAPLDSTKAESMLLHQDDLVMGIAYKLSGDGSLSNDKPLASIHPDLLAELFGQRLGLQVGTKHTMRNTDTSQVIKVSGVYARPPASPNLPQVDGEILQIRYPEIGGRDALPDPANALPKMLKPGEGQKLLIVRAAVTGGKEISDDADQLFRFSMGNVRLMAKQTSGDAVEYKDYFPVATLDYRGVALNHRIDDFLLSTTDSPRTIDFVFVVDDAAVNSTGKGQMTLNDGSFLEMKRYGRVDLSSKKISIGVPLNPDKGSIVLKPEVDKAVADAVKVSDIEPPAATVPSETTGTGTPAPQDNTDRPRRGIGN